MAIETTGTKNDWNGQFVECAFDVINGDSAGHFAFPIIKCDLSNTQDLVQHKYPQLGGASIEGTGVNPISFKVSAPFLVGMQRGNGETWDADQLYPETFNKIVNIFRESVSPTLLFTHPTMGQYIVKVVGFTTSVIESMKNGQMLDFDLIEHNDQNTFIDPQSGDLGDAETAATEWDEQIDNFDPPIDVSSPLRKISLSDMMGDLRAVLDSSSLFLNQIDMKAQNALFQLKLLRDSILRFDGAVNKKTGQVSSAINSVRSGVTNVALFVQMHSAQGNLISLLNRVEKGVWSIVNDQPVTAPAAARLQAKAQREQAANGEFLQLITNTTTIFGRRSLRVLILEGNMSLGQIALMTKNEIHDLIDLNPGISQNILIPQGTQIVYLGA